MIIGSKGIPVSYRSDRLIKELKRDIQECGENKIFVVWMKNLKKYGVEVAVNYDFMVEDDPIDKSELNEDERFVLMTGAALLDYLVKQNEIIEVYEI